MTIQPDQATIEDLLVHAVCQANLIGDSSPPHAELIHELVYRLRRLHIWRLKVVAVIDPHLCEEDGSDLVSDEARISNMLERLSTPSTPPA